MNDPAIGVAGWKYQCTQNSSLYALGGERGGYHMPGPTTVCGKPEYLALEWEDVGKYVPDLVIIGLSLSIHTNKTETLLSTSSSLSTAGEKIPKNLSTSSSVHGSLPMYVLQYQSMDHAPDTSSNSKHTEYSKELVWIPLSEAYVNDDNANNSRNNIIETDDNEEWIHDGSNDSHDSSEKDKDTENYQEWDWVSKFPDHYEDILIKEFLPLSVNQSNVGPTTGEVRKNNEVNHKVMYHDIINSIQQHKESIQKYSNSPSSIPSPVQHRTSPNTMVGFPEVLQNTGGSSSPRNFRVNEQTLGYPLSNKFATISNSSIIKGNNQSTMPYEGKRMGTTRVSMESRKYETTWKEKKTKGDDTTSNPTNAALTIRGKTIPGVSGSGKN